MPAWFRGSDNVAKLHRLALAFHQRLRPRILERRAAAKAARPPRRGRRGLVNGRQLRAARLSVDDRLLHAAATGSVSFVSGARH
jgi:hypothetical protein